MQPTAIFPENTINDHKNKWLLSTFNNNWISLLKSTLTGPDHSSLPYLMLVLNTFCLIRVGFSLFFERPLRSDPNLQKKVVSFQFWKVLSIGQGPGRLMFFAIELFLFWLSTWLPFPLEILLSVLRICLFAFPVQRN